MRLVLAFVLISLLAAPAASAQEHVLEPTTPVEDAAFWEDYRRVLAAAESPSQVTERRTESALRWLLPWFEVDRRSAGGRTTLLSIRNTRTGQTNDVTVSIASTSGKLLSRREHRLDPAEILTLNLRDVPEIRAGRSGLAHGYVLVESTRPTTADFFAVTPSENSATGGRLAESVCTIWDLRFLAAGVFSGGTEIQLFVVNPLGASQTTDTPSAVIGVTDEDGRVLGTVNLWTESNVVITTAREILAKLGGRRRVPGFGGLVITFADEADRGHVQGTFSAQGRFSIGLPGSCLASFRLI